jgi:hypothetical protein
MGNPLQPLLNDPQIVPINWPSASGKSYGFQLHPIGTIYQPKAGVYIFCKLRPDGLWGAVYVGETDNFWRRLTDQLRLHHRWESIRSAGATHISTLHVVSDNTARLNIETDLRRHLNPPCNLQ